MKTLNINKDVRIRVTDMGLDILNSLPSDEFKVPNVDENGYCEITLVEAMYIFGKFMYMGAIDYPISMLIQIEDTKFESE